MKKIIIVLGMHRSGTSAITRGLQVMGVGLGDRLPSPMEGDNPKGFWEDIDLNALNISMLSALGSDWHYLAPIGPEEVDTLRNKGYFLRAVELLQQKIDNVPIFGFKDPRVARLLPFWKEVISHCQLEAGYVLAVRHPRSVVKSLATRNGFCAEKSYLLWLGHVITSFANTAGEQRVLVDYDRLMQSPDRELNRIAKELNLEIDPLEFQIYKTEFLDEGLRHTVYDLNDLLSDDACPPLVHEIYSVLLDAASDNTLLGDLKLQNQIAHWVGEFNRIKSPLVLADKLSQSVQALTAQIMWKDQVIAQKELAFIQANNQQALFHNALEAIVNSRAWKMILVLQKIHRRLLPEKSFQARAVRFLNKAFHFIQKNGLKPSFQMARYRARRERRTIKIDSPARISLQNILNHLNITLKSEQVLTALINALGREKTGQIMANIVDVEKFIFAKNNGKVYPLIHASHLSIPLPQMRKRNILFITAQFPSPHHGGGNRVLNFIKTLSTDNNIYLCTAFFAKEHEHILSGLAPYCQEILKIPHARFGGNQKEIRNWLGATTIDIVHYEWAHSLENYDPDFGRIQIFTYMEAVSLRLLMDMERIPPLTVTWAEKFGQLGYTLQLEFVQASQLDARVAVTTKDADFFRNLYPFQEYVILNHGLSFEEFTLPDLKPEPNTLIFVGNYLHYPNAEALEYFFKEIWKDIRKEIPNVRIYVVGTNPTDSIMRMADGQHVIVTGTVEDVRPYIQKATVCIAPLISGAGLRGKVIEYAALRRTFVATSIASTDLVFKDGVDYFCADTPHEFSDKIITLLNDPQLASRMASCAYETARQNYDNQRLTGFLLSLYDYLEKPSQ